MCLTPQTSACSNKLYTVFYFSNTVSIARTDMAMLFLAFSQENQWSFIANMEILKAEQEDVLIECHTPENSASKAVTGLLIYCSAKLQETCGQ